MKKNIALQKSKSTKEAALPKVVPERLTSQKSVSSKLENLDIQDIIPTQEAESRVTDVADRDGLSSPSPFSKHRGSHSDSKVTSFGFSLFDLDDQDFD